MCYIVTMKKSFWRENKNGFLISVVLTFLGGLLVLAKHKELDTFSGIGLIPFSFCSIFILSYSLYSFLGGKY